MASSKSKTPTLSAGASTSSTVANIRQKVKIGSPKIKNLRPIRLGFQGKIEAFLKKYKKYRDSEL
jgi:hypothetical protein